MSPADHLHCLPAHQLTDFLLYVLAVLAGRLHAGYDSVIQTLMELRERIAKLETRVEGISEDSKRQRERLDKISHRIYAATAVGTVLLGLFGWIVANLPEVVTVLWALPR